MLASKDYKDSCGERWWERERREYSLGLEEAVSGKRRERGRKEYFKKVDVYVKGNGRWGIG